MSGTSPWHMAVPKPGKGDYSPCPAGNHPGRVVGLYDVGLQPDVRVNRKTGLDERIEVRKLVVVFELAKKDPAGSPYFLAQKYTWSMSESSNFYKLVLSVTGRRHTPGTDFDPTTMLGLPVMVNVTNTAPNENGAVYANIKDAAQFPEGFPVPTTTIEPRAWSILEGTPPPTDSWLPRVYGKTIADLANESCVERGPGRQSAGPAPAKNSVIRTDLSQYPAMIQALMTVYGLPPGYTVDDLAEAAREKGIGDTHFGLLHAEAVPF